MAHAAVAVPLPGTVRSRAYAKVFWRIMPMLIVCYIANFIDRINIGMAQLQMRGDLGFTDQIYGVGVALFFVGFILFEIPSNLMLDRIGVRKTFLRIMVLWGLISAGMVFVRTPMQFYVVRFLLGASEAGFFPGVILYLTYWFPSSTRARMNSVFLLSLPISGALGSLFSGAIMHGFEGTLGLRGYQWMFLMEGIPSVLLGFVAYRVLADNPRSAPWLTAEERDAVEADLAAERAANARPSHYNFLKALRDPKLYVMAMVCGCGYVLANAISFWSPLIINASGVKDVLNVGTLTALPLVVATATMLLVGWHSDKHRERRWHAACSYTTAAVSLLLISIYWNQPTIVIVLLALTAAGHYSAMTTFWMVPTVYLSRSAAAGGISLVTSLGSIGAALAPVLLGWIKTETGSLALGLQISAAVILFGALTLVIGVPARALREQAAGP